MSISIVAREPMIWLDALDVPLHLYLGTAEFQPGPVNALPETIPDAAFATANILPDGVVSADHASPVFRYPYDAASAAVSAAPLASDGSRRVRYVNPMTGGCAMAFIDSHLVQLDAQTATRPVRTSSSAVCCVVEGHGESRIGDDTISWSPRDIFTLPQGARISHKCNASAARLFIVSDRNLLARLGLLRDEFDRV